MCLEKLGSFTEEVSSSIIYIESPCELMLDLGKSILSMFHFRILSWNQFRVRIVVLSWVRIC